MLNSLKNTALNSLKRKNLPVIARKIFLRLKEPANTKIQRDVLQWCQARAIPCEELTKSLNAPLWAETQEICKALKANAEKKLKGLDIDMGGGGNYPLLYFLARHLSAKVVVETGVAAGWSSQTLLTALRDNKQQGHLYSSDFPYFRQSSPEDLIGYIVDEELKENWDLFIDGDQNNLPKIAALAGRIDIFHYDSDKSYAGRVFALEALKNNLHDDSVIICDDIQDNAHFKDYVESKQVSFRVFEFEGKYIGLIAPFL